MTHEEQNGLVEALREKFRTMMLQQPTTENRDTYSDGFQQALAWAIEELARAALQAPQEAGLRVKSLEWRGSEGVWAKADALFGATYRITEYAGMAKPFKLETVGFVGPSGHYELIEDAKAVAQADFDRRIRSVLSQPEAQVGDDTDSVAVEICDAVMDWMVRRELIDADQEYHPDEIVEALEGIFTDPVQPEAQAVAEVEVSPTSVLSITSAALSESNNVLMAVHEWQAGSEMLPLDLWARVRDVLRKAGRI